MRSTNKLGLIGLMFALIAICVAGCGAEKSDCGSVCSQAMISSLKSTWEYEKWPEKPAISGRVVENTLESKHFSALGKMGTQQNLGKRINFDIYDPDLGVSVGSVNIEIGQSFDTVCDSLVARCAPFTSGWPPSLKLVDNSSRAGDVALVLPFKSTATGNDSSVIQRMIFIRNNVSVGICNYGKTRDFDTVKIARMIDSKLVEIINQNQLRLANS